MTELDVRDWKQQDAELKQEINRAVKDTQRVLIQPYPHKLIMSKQQYDMLQDDPAMRGLYDSDGHMFLTEANIMEVVIK